MMHRNLLALASSLAATMILSNAPVAHAQDALGNGNALDRNSQVGSGGQNTRAPANPYAGRNSIITGEVIGGREFRGRVGYTAPGDFRGNLGSNDLFRFRADSAWSNPAGFRLGNATYDQLRFGQGLGVLELTRSGSGATLDQVQQSPGPVSFAQLAESRMRYDNQVMTASSSSRMATAMQSRTLATAVRPDGQSVAVTASSARGLSIDHYNERWEELGLTPYDQIRLREEGASALPGAERPPAGTEAADRRSAAEKGDRVGMQFETRFEGLRDDSSASEGARVDPTQQTDYARVLQNVVDRYARAGDRDVKVDPAILKTLKQQYDTLRGELTGEQTSDAAPQQNIDPTTGQPLPMQSPSEQAPMSSPTPGRTDTGESSSPDPRNRLNQPAPEEPGSDDGVETPAQVDLSKLGPALRHGEQIERLSSAEQGRLNELLTAAEEQLKRGEYMLAEQRFQRAIRFSPGNPMALAGAANAQIGAGLYLPAGYTLRALFTQHPEMIDATYAGGLLPPRERLDAAIEAAKGRLDAANDRSANALLLAYLGRQINDRALMQQGIAAMSGDAAVDPLAELLRTVWLETSEAPSPTPTPEK